MEKYLELMKELKELGLQLMDNAEGDENWYDELECMDMHLECGLDLLGKAIG